MELNAIMASQLRSLQSTVQMSVMNKALQMNTSAATEMLESLPKQASAPHPHKGASIDVKA
ncbi:MAG TPA: putative motility protein [Sporosarcina sp.]|nr:putative motility protein [Sporosarcina sp.]